MNNVDRQYLDLLKDILENGTYKQTRAGVVKSVFGRQMRFNLKEGLPILTTKKVFTKGVIHELIWFLKNDTNIKYLVDNNVHIWDDDAYRFYLEKVNTHNRFIIERNNLIESDEFIEYYYDNLDEKHDSLEIGGFIAFGDIYKSDDEYDEVELEDDDESELEGVNDFGNSLKEIIPLSKEEFLKCVVNEDYVSFLSEYNDFGFVITDYRYGELGPVYGNQWRSQGVKQIDQIKNIIDTLKTNPDDRRMICMAWNSNELEEMALPPCHYGFQVYTRELSPIERLEWLWEHSNGEYDEWKSPTRQSLDDLGVPTRELSLMFNMRSNDFCCGNPYNIAQYGMLVYMFCEICNMVPGELIYNGGDIHVYENHFEAAREQLLRKGSDKIPTLKFARKINNINDFKYEDFIIENYEPDPPIKYKLNVGL